MFWSTLCIFLCLYVCMFACVCVCAWCCCYFFSHNQFYITTHTHTCIAIAITIIILIIIISLFLNMRFALIHTRLKDWLMALWLSAPIQIYTLISFCLTIDWLGCVILRQLTLLSIVDKQFFFKKKKKCRTCLNEWTKRNERANSWICLCVGDSKGACFLKYFILDFGKIELFRRTQRPLDFVQI